MKNKRNRYIDIGAGIICFIIVTLGIISIKNVGNNSQDTKVNATPATIETKNPSITKSNISDNNNQETNQSAYSTVEPSEKPQTTSTPKNNTNTSNKSTNSTTKSAVQSFSTVYSTPSPAITQSITQENKTEEMVWVGETGTKYHYQNCRTLKGKGHQITMKQALAEGRTACKVCH